MIGKAIYHSMSNDASITAIVADRIYPLVIPQGVDFPAIAWAKTGGDPDKTKQEPATVNNASVDIKACHANYLQSEILGSYIRQLFDKMSGTVNAVDIISTSFEGESSPIYDPDAQVYMNIITFNFFYKY